MTLWRKWWPDHLKDSVEHHGMNPSLHNIDVERLDHVANYLSFLIEAGVVDGKMAPQTAEAVKSLREAISIQEAAWLDEASNDG
jgi:hypothetical protein